MSETYAVVTLHPSPQSRVSEERPMLRRVSRTVARCAYAIMSGSTRIAVATTAAAYLAANTFVESAFWQGVKSLAARRRSTEPDPTPDMPLDPVDLASWDSFPASDPPAY